MNMRAKCLVLVSGGLDSQLAIGLMQRQDVDVEAVSFYSYFSSGIKEGRLGYWAHQAARHFGVKMHFVFLRESFIAMLKDPRYGYGSAVNPCIDCKVLMLIKAQELFAETGASFVATGEVIGQRPMSQLKHSLALIEKRSGLEGRIVRPLSGKCLPPTEAEKQGIVQREKFEDIVGRGRSRQKMLAEEFGLKKYPQPAGGCILTDKTYGARLRDAFKYGVTSEREYIALQCGRLVRFDSSTKAIIGRNKRECEMLRALADPDDYIVALSNDAPGPLLLLKGAVSAAVLERAGQIVHYYSKQKNAPEAEVEYFQVKKGARAVLRVRPSRDETAIASLIVQ
jgi:tRNA-uridine 2-sulfurtransferase